MAPEGGVVFVFLNRADPGTSCSSGKRDVQTAPEVDNGLAKQSTENVTK